VKAHAEDWNAYRQKLAGAAAAEKPAEPAPSQEAAGKITAKVEEKAPKAQEPAKDVLKLSKGEAADQSKAKAAGAEAKALQDKLAAAQEEAAAKDKALKEANSRIGDLEKNIQDMKRLLEAQNKQMADLQKQAAAKPVAEAAAPAAPVAEKAPEKAPEPAAKPAEEKPAVEAAPPQEPLVKAQPEAEKPKAKPRVVEPVAEPSFMEELLGNPLYLAGGGAVAVGGLLAALWAVGRRRKKSLASFEDSIMTGGDLKANTVFGNTGGGQIDTGDTSFLTDFSQGGMGAIDTNDVDPIAEAEVYMAYGRDAQAEEILKEAMNKDPNRHEVQLKLLEIYAGRRNQEAFEALASELYAATSGQGPIWEKAAELGRGLDANNPLYAAGGTGGAPVAAAAAAAIGAAAAGAMAPEAEARAAPPELDFNLDIESEASVPLDQATVPGEFTTEMPLDFNLDTTTPEVPTEAQASSDAALEFDLGSIIPQAVEKQGEAPEDLGASMDLSFDLPDLDELSQPQAAAATSPAEADTLGGLDFQFDLDVPSTEAAAAPAALAMPDLDLGGLDLGAGPAANVPLEEATTLAGPGESWEEASTKLDLARAYVEMGDKEGAREILEEVVQEGGPEQQADAKKLLATLT
jgi:pilus assembly protein FimV